MLCQHWETKGKRNDNNDKEMQYYKKTLQDYSL